MMVATKEQYFEAGFINHMTVEDVTEQPDKLSQAFKMVAEGYSRLSSHKLSYDEVYSDLCQIGIYNNANFSRTLLLTGYNPYNRKVEPLGTARLLLAIPESLRSYLPPLESMDLVNPVEGWNNFNYGNFNPEISFEIGRLAVTHSVRSRFISQKVKVSSIIAQKLFITAAKIAKSKYNKYQSWGIMTDYICDLLSCNSIEIRSIDRTLLNREKHEVLFQKYDKYWFRKKPQLYNLIFKS
jgi:hypothetical protein